MRFNLNDYVRFVIKRDSIGLFEGRGVQIGPPDAAGNYPARSQFHNLIDVAGPHLKMWLIPPIDLNVEVESSLPSPSDS